MNSITKFLLVKVLIVALTLFFFVAVAIPKYVNIQRHKAASECLHNQILVETALALAYAESLQVNRPAFPAQLTPSMFEEGIIPVCPVSGEPIVFDPTTGTACCPQHIAEHNRSF